MFPSKKSSRKRIILAFDMDNFYCACERIRDPSLCNKPVGIQQKQILATASYEARALGVGKLQLVKEAIKVCPELIIVNGEDLTHYRAFSRKIWRLVKSICGGNVEKLGMDELFCDVTELIDQHIKEVDTATQSSSQAFFNLNPKRKSTQDRSNGFYYDPSEVSGYVVPEESSVRDSEERRRFRIGSHLAFYVRDKIHSELGFTTSAGVSHSKLLSKLMASINKPAKQTTWYPEIDTEEARKAFMAPYQLGKIPGYGYKTVKILRHHLFGDELPSAGAFTDAPEDTHPYEHLKQVAEEETERPLIVQDVREKATARQFRQWYGERLGTRLWFLLFGEDDEPVNSAPDYPATISVEDSYPQLMNYEEALMHMRELTTALMRRLQLELVDEPASLLPPNAGNKQVFARYPQNIRLSTRIDRNSRETQTMKAPAEIFDLKLSPKQRSDVLNNHGLSTFLRKAMDTHPEGHLRIINIAAVNFVSEAPPADVRSLFTENKKRPRGTQEKWSTMASADIDEATLNELPPEMAAEIRKSLNMPGTSAKKSKKSKSESSELVSCDWPKRMRRKAFTRSSRQA